MHYVLYYIIFSHTPTKFGCLLIERKKITESSVIIQVSNVDNQSLIKINVIWKLQPNRIFSRWTILECNFTQLQSLALQCIYNYSMRWKSFFLMIYLFEQSNLQHHWGLKWPVLIKLLSCATMMMLSYTKHPVSHLSYIMHILLLRIFHDKRSLYIAT